MSYYVRLILLHITFFVKAYFLRNCRYCIAHNWKEIYVALSNLSEILAFSTEQNLAKLDKKIETHRSLCAEGLQLRLCRTHLYLFKFRPANFFILLMILQKNIIEFSLSLGFPCNLNSIQWPKSKQSIQNSQI